jgi:hypothetical protein
MSNRNTPTQPSGVTPNVETPPSGPLNRSPSASPTPVDQKAKLLLKVNDDISLSAQELRQDDAVTNDLPGLLWYFLCFLVAKPCLASISDVASASNSADGSDLATPTGPRIQYWKFGSFLMSLFSQKSPPLRWSMP